MDATIFRALVAPADPSRAKGERLTPPSRTPAPRTIRRAAIAPEFGQKRATS